MKMDARYAANLSQLNGPKTNHGTSRTEEGSVAKMNI